MSRTRFLWTALAALMYGGLAVHFTDAFGYLTAPVGSDTWTLAVASVLSALVIGGWTWDRLVERGSYNTLGMAVLSGLLTGSLSHVLMWLLVAIVNFGPVLVMGWVYSLPLLGWITVPLAVLGALFLGSNRGGHGQFVIPAPASRPAIRGVFLYASTGPDTALSA